MSKSLSNRYDFFINVFTSVVEDLPDEMFDYMINYYKENDIKFKIPSKPELHTIQNWTEKLDDKERIYSRVPTKKDLKTHFVSVALSSVFESNWFGGISKTGFTETNGPILCKFVPEAKSLECAWINPLFLWTADIDKSLSYEKLEVSIQNQLIVKDTVEPLVQYSIYNNDFDFGRSEDNEYLMVNNAIEDLVSSTDLNKVGTVKFDNGLILIVAETQVWFTFSPIWCSFTVKIPNMIKYHDRDWLEKYGLL